MTKGRSKISQKTIRISGRQKNIYRTKAKARNAADKTSKNVTKWTDKFGNYYTLRSK